MSIDPEKTGNLEDIEKQFAVKAVTQAETYMGLLQKIPGSQLKLTKYDNDIYEKLLQSFPEFKDPNVAASVNEEDMKSSQGKTKWRNFCEQFKEIEDYNFGTLLRSKASEDYTQENTIFAVRIQFYAVEIARNKYGLNDWICKK